ncbi:MAG: MotA/TolQ/ExbB proton channel family protein [Butyrivibrio sp.]|nr:MotA/TolQ/ExbB proton channel family protein [Butyrivibrio sp.]
MRSYGDTLKLLLASIVTNDIIILIAAIVAVCLLVLTVVLSRLLRKSCGDAKKKNKRIPKFWVSYTNMSYNIFITMISIFPLLGMLGTVFGLLGLDLASGDMDNIKNNFFIALTSTAWGIIFSVIFKILHAVIASGVEEVLEIAKPMIEEDGQ